MMTVAMLQNHFGWLLTTSVMMSSTGNHSAWWRLSPVWTFVKIAIVSVSHDSDSCGIVLVVISFVYAIRYFW